MPVPPTLRRTKYRRPHARTDRIEVPGVSVDQNAPFLRSSYRPGSFTHSPSVSVAVFSDRSLASITLRCLSLARKIPVILLISRRSAFCLAGGPPTCLGILFTAPVSTNALSSTVWATVLALKEVNPGSSPAATTATAIFWSGATTSPAPYWLLSPPLAHPRTPTDSSAGSVTVSQPRPNCHPSADPTFRPLVVWSTAICSTAELERIRLPPTTPSPVKIRANRTKSLGVELKPADAKPLLLCHGSALPRLMTGATVPGAGTSVG